MDRAQTTHNFKEQNLSWIDVTGGKYVANLEAIGNNHVWIDPRLLGSPSVFVSEVLMQKFKDAKIVGVGFGDIEAV